jgi:predicted nucleic acid-binding Zn ribbon protein
MIQRFCDDACRQRARRARLKEATALAVGEDLGVRVWVEPPRGPGGQFVAVQRDPECLVCFAPPLEGEQFCSEACLITHEGIYPHRRVEDEGELANV